MRWKAIGNWLKPKTFDGLNRLFLFIFILCCSCLYAQEDHNEESTFSTIKLGASYSINVNSEDFHTYWNQSHGLDLFVETPFYFGDISLGMTGAKNIAVVDGVIDIYTNYSYLGWGLNFTVGPSHNSGLWIGGTFGIYQIYAREGLPEWEFESEVGNGLGIRLYRSIINNWDFNLSLHTNFYHTKKKINLTYFNVGLSKKITSPGWLKKVLE